MDTLADWKGLLPGEKTVVGEAEAEVAGLVIGPAGVYVLLTVDAPLPEGWSFRLGCNGKTVAGTVDYCEQKDGRYLLGVEIENPPQIAALAS